MVKLCFCCLAATTLLTAAPGERGSRPGHRDRHRHIDRHGTVMASLPATAFSVTRDGQPRAIVSFGEQDLPASIGIVFDTSFSMGRTLPQAKVLLHAFFYTVTLTSDSAVAFFPGGNTVTIPAGANSATVTIATLAVAAGTPVNIGTSLGAVILNAGFTVVPVISISSVTAAPSIVFSFFGGNFSFGTVRLGGSASDNLVVNLYQLEPWRGLSPGHTRGCCRSKLRRLPDQRIAARRQYDSQHHCLHAEVVKHRNPQRPESNGY